MNIKTAQDGNLAESVAEDQISCTPTVKKVAAFVKEGRNRRNIKGQILYIIVESRRKSQSIHICSYFISKVETYCIKYVQQL